MSVRDTKFAGFARAVVDELVSNGPSGWGYDEVSLCLARRAYDLVTHAFEAVNPIALQSTLDEEEVTRTIPDMPELPEDEKQ